jgi:leader peptidase (prepilin peptidase)/N-methyltransferase
VFTAFITIAAALSGLVIGSFLNVVVWRLPRRESLSTPGSHCPNCNYAIRWFDNVPVISWLILRGRCRHCGTAISLRYPFVELFTALFFVSVALWGLGPILNGPTAWTGEVIARVLMVASLLYLASISVTLTLIDLDVHRLPNSIVLPAYAVGAVLLGAASFSAGDAGGLGRAAVGLVVMFVAYLVMALVYPGGMGFGDVKLAGVLGLYLGWLGWSQLVVGAFAAFLLGGVWAILLLLSGRATRKSGIPFGPWMIAGAWVGIFAGADIAEWYLTMFGLAQG